MAFYRRRKFTVLLVTLGLLLLLRPLLDPGETSTLTFAVLRALVTLAGVFVLFQRRQSRVAALGLGLPAVAGNFATFWLGENLRVPAALLLHLVPLLFTFYVVVVIVKTIFRDRDVSADEVNGAFCGYLLLALAFGHLYSLVEVLVPGSYRLEEHLGPFPQEEGGRHALLTYFSLVTLTSVGYGDIHPSSGPARTLACAEAVLGQFYVAVIIAELMALKVSAALRDSGGGRPGPRE